MPSGVFNLISEETFSEKMDAQNQLLSAQNQLISEIALAQRVSMMPTSWLQVREIVREGFANKVFSIGDQFVCQRNGGNLIWDIIGIDHNVQEGQHNITLQLHDCFPIAIQFDAPEALYYTTGGLRAGDKYNFNVGNSDYYHMNITTAIPAGSYLFWDVNVPDDGTNVRNSGVIKISLTKGGQTEGAYYANVWHGKLDSDDPTLTGTLTVNNSDINHVKYGNNNYKDSALRQWLNSDAAAGSVWTPQNDYDGRPTWADTVDGFMRGIDPDFLSVVSETTITTNADSQNAYTINDKFYLLSRNEVYGGSEGLPGEGSYFGYYKNFSGLAQEGTGADSNRIKLLNGVNQGWWLRTLATSSSYEVKVVAGNNGRIAVNNANYASGVAPACTIS